MTSGGAVTFRCDGTITLTRTITNSTRTTLDAAGHQVTVSGGGKVRLFAVSADADFTLANLTIRDGHARHGSGLLNAGGKVVLQSVVFEGHVARYEAETNGGFAGGAAILNAGGLVLATNCVFHSNVAIQAQDVYQLRVQVQGGALCNLDGQVVLDSCLFTSNAVFGPARIWEPRDGSGGAIHNAGTLLAVHCDFRSNSASGGAGAASGNGGAICNFGALTLEQSVVSGNGALGTEGLPGRNGGTMAFSGEPGEVGGPGGRGNGGALFNAGSAVVTDSRFVGNSALGGAGGAGGAGGDAFPPAPGRVTIGGNGGTGGAGGAAYGAICDINGLCRLSNCVLEANSAFPGPGGDGGRAGFGTTFGFAGSPGQRGAACGGLYSIGAVVAVSLFTHNLPGGNCAGYLTDAGGNLSTDSTCPLSPWQPPMALAYPDYSVLHSFGASDILFDGTPNGPVVLDADGTIYSSSWGGDYPSRGTVFAVHTNAFQSSYRVIRERGQTLRPGIALQNGMIYGTSSDGGVSEWGTLFMVKTNGDSFTVLKSFGGEEGRGPNGRLLIVDNFLYGTTPSGGGYGYGTIYRVRTDGAAFEVVKTFGDEMKLGVRPSPGLFFAGSHLYGATERGGSHDAGTIFQVERNGSGFSILQVLGEGNSGCYPVLRALSGSALYGTTAWYEMGRGESGTIFSIRTDGSGFRTLRRVDEQGFQGAAQINALAVRGERLFGVTEGGGLYGQGTLFMMNTDGSGYTVLKHFQGVDGARPSSLSLHGDMLLGTTAIGGFYNYGVIFRVLLTPPRTALYPTAQTAEAGSAATFTGFASGWPPPSLQWYFNSTNLLAYSAAPSLTVANLVEAHSGTYTLVATNDFGFSTSSAPLNVIPRVPRSSVLGLRIDGDSDSAVHLESSDAPLPTAFWVPLAELRLDGGSAWHFGNFSEGRRWFRAWQADPAWPATLGFHRIQVLQLTGSVGATVQLDWIHPIGALDDWHSLGPVTLTNNPHLFYDTSGVEAPNRLYRLRAQ